MNTHEGNLKVVSAAGLAKAEHHLFRSVVVLTEASKAPICNAHELLELTREVGMLVEKGFSLVALAELEVHNPTLGTPSSK
jgi:hypothetical protein